VKIICKVSATSPDAEAEFNALYIELTPIKAGEIMSLVELCAKHKLSEVRRYDSGVTLFDLDTLHDVADITPELEARYVEIENQVTLAALDGKPYCELGAHFDFPQERAVELTDYTVERTVYDDAFFWTIQHRKYDDSWESSLVRFADFQADYSRRSGPPR
jgi:hypothetical protein